MLLCGFYVYKLLVRKDSFSNYIIYCRQALERSMLAEMENLQSQIQQAKHATEINHLTAENLKREVSKN